MFVRVLMALAGFALCFAAVADSRAPKQKAPWEWTAAERARARRDVAQRRERVATFLLESRQQAASARRPAPADVIDGSRHPELFFTTELFEMLVRSAFVSLPQTYPTVIRQRSSDLFRDPAEWDRFAVIVRDYAELLRQQRAAANALDRPAVSKVQDQKCAAAARAIREARRVFGKARFDRMLYETVPRSVKTTFSADTDFELSIGKAEEREERCQ